jgi:DNA-binding PadR family transcriptional regulator
VSKGEFLGEFEQVVLLAVARLQQEGYGVSISQEIERCTGREVTVGSVYATLDRLEAKGMVRSWEGESTPRRGGRARRHFAIEARGVEALEAARGMMERLWDGVDFEAPGTA